MRCCQCNIRVRALLFIAAGDYMRTVTVAPVHLTAPEMEARHVARYKPDSSVSLFNRPQHPVAMDIMTLQAGESRNLCAGEDYLAVVCLQGMLALDGDGHSRTMDQYDSVLIPPYQKAQLKGLDIESRYLRISYRADARERGLLSRLPGRARSAVKRTLSAVARFKHLKPIRERWYMQLIPEAFRDVLSPRDLYLLIGPAKARARYAITGPDHFLVTLVRTPPGTGPALHIHRFTTEIFVVLEGQFRVYWGDQGEHEVILNPYDAIAIPPGLNRAFENIGGEQNAFMPVVIGANDELKDIVWLPDIKATVSEQVPAPWFALAKTFVLRFAQRS